jgi:hypothetical protein
MSQLGWEITLVFENDSKTIQTSSSNLTREEAIINTVREFEIINHQRKVYTVTSKPLIGGNF